eukprot:NODE_7458_length_455_cov_22.886700_g6623_i0.p1 GENE.NODE_7458_length_455_cov_22.886700_g6623_i0~~NODE_7458_length_455_cov_22.886700_g6623_i0.p1  ORF type:complete len:87 (-),score=22.21 NODE_7458_length_455_cov_22.886700_g6623_i0:94-354(-)
MHCCWGGSSSSEALLLTLRALCSTGCQVLWANGVRGKEAEFLLEAERDFDMQHVCVDAPDIYTVDPPVLVYSMSLKASMRSPPPPC